LIARIPDTVQQAWGDAAVRDFTAWIVKILKEQAVPRDEWGQMTTRMGAVEQRLDGVEQRLDGVEQRLDGVEQRLGAVENRLDVVEHGLDELKLDVRDLRHTVDERFDRMHESFNARIDRVHESIDARFDQLNERIMVQTRWTVGVLALFGTIISIIVGIGQFAR